MPRPKVKPEDRRRAVKACLSCKISKIRCDAQTPCVACVRRGRGRSCVYSTEVQRNPNTPRNRAARSSAQRNAGGEETDGYESSSAGQDQSIRNGTDSELDNRQSCARLMHSRTLMSSKGQKVYVGAASSLSFLQFIREVVGRCVGSCSFTESDTINMMLEIPQAQQNESPLTWSKDEVAVQHRKDLIQASLEATSGILDLYDMEELLEFLNEWPPDEALQDTPGSAIPVSKRMDLAVVCLALAIGGQCQESQAQDRIESANYFAQAQRIAFEGFLLDPSIDMIRVFLLMAFYLLGACHRNAACMYLGVAAKAASTLGLHQAELYSACTPEEVNHRLRCWRSMKVLDTLVSAILGRTSSTLVIQSAADEFDKISLEVISPGARSLESMYQLCLIIEQVQQQLPAASTLDFAVAERLLDRLGKWTGSLPEDLRNFTIKSPAPTAHQQNRELLVGATHVACSYYFTVAIITRPFLIAHLMAQLQSRGKNNATARPRPDAEHTAKLAQACIEAATYMAHICADAVQSNMLHDNMCILKAWVFAAGLLLGFSLFVEEGAESTRAAVADAYNSSCVVLNRFARLSPQAEHYYGILNNFADAITRYHQQLSESRRRSTGSYVYQIFTIANTEQEAPPTDAADNAEESLGWTYDDGASSLGSVGSVDDFIRMTTEEDAASLATFWDEISSGNQLSTFF